MPTLREQNAPVVAGLGAGRSGEAFRAGDWPALPLGSVSAWPPRLRFALELIFAADRPLFVCWGERQLLFHNDGCLIFGDGRVVHGLPLAEAWPQVAAVLAPAGERLRTDRSVILEDRRLILSRRLPREEVYLTFTCSPLREENGAVGGMLVSCSETTAAFLARRRQQAEQELAGCLRQAVSAEAVCWQAGEVLAAAGGFPYALIYLGSGAPDRLRLAAAGGPDARGAPRWIAEAAHPLLAVLRGGSPELLASELLDVPARGVPSAFALPLLAPGGGRLGVLVLGLEPCRPFDTAYCSHCGLLASQVAAALGYARLAAERRPVPRAPSAQPEDEERRLLAESESRLRAIIDFAPAAIYVKDLCFHYMTVNRHFLSIIGRERIQVEGRDDYSLFPSDAAERFRATDKEVLASGRPIELLEDFQLKDGMRTYLTVKFPLVDDLGHLYGLAGISTDMTERRQMEESLQARQRQLRIILDTAPVAIIYVDSDQRYRFLNRAYARRFGLAPEEIIGRTVREVRGGKAYAAIREKIEAALAGQAVRYEMSDRFRGEQREWQVAYSPDIDARGRVRGFIAVIDEITDRKRSEERLQAIADELARSNRELEQFAYVVSHDLREPLRTIGGFLNLIERRYGAAFDDHGRELIHFAADGAGRMDRMITDLLEYSRVQRQEPVLGPVDLFDAWLAVIDNLRALIEETGAHISHDQLPVVTGDAGQLTRLLQNLIGNAIKFRGERVPEIRIESSRREGEWLFAVRDNGIGIPPQSRDRIFQVFQRLHTQQEYPGTGIGLAICKKIVERHGGRIWVESQPGQGTTFFFTLAERPAAGGESD